MYAQQFPERQPSRIATGLVVLGAVLAWIVVGLVVDRSASWPMMAVVLLAGVLALLVGTVIWGTASGPIHGWAGIAGRATVAMAVGIVIGELAALALFAGSIDRRLDDRAARNAASAPAVIQAVTALDTTRAARTSLDTAVDQARQHRNDALVVARCEYHPTPECPQTRITGVPGVGPETRTANDLLTDARLELESAVSTRERQGPALDAQLAHDEHALADARHTVLANSEHGVSARWVAMDDLTLADAGALTLRLLTVAFAVLVYLLPLILRLWHGETTHDRQAAAHAKRERAELAADTAIAIKRAEVRQAAETMWAEQKLANARLAVEAQTAIDRAFHRRQIAAALVNSRPHTDDVTGPVHASSERTFAALAALDKDMYLPIAAEAEAASQGVLQLPTADPQACPERTANVPAQLDSAGHVDPDGEHPAAVNQPTSAVADMPADPLKAAARWIRPLVPTFVVRALDSTVQPLRAARQAFEEVEEITFLLRRTHKVTIDSESQQQPPQLAALVADEPAGVPAGPTRIESSRVRQDQVRDPAIAGQQAELVERAGPQELRAPAGPRQLPSGQ